MGRRVIPGFGHAVLRKVGVPVFVCECVPWCFCVHVFAGGNAFCLYSAAGTKYDSQFSGRPLKPEAGVTQPRRLTRGTRASGVSP